MSAPERGVDRKHPCAASWVVDRRVFMGTLAAASAVTLLPLPSGAARIPQPEASAPALLGDWHIDDQWGPRYAVPIAYGRPATDDAVADAWTQL